MEGPADVVAVLDPDVSSVGYSMNCPNPTDVLQKKKKNSLLFKVPSDHNAAISHHDSECGCSDCLRFIRASSKATLSAMQTEERAKCFYPLTKGVVVIRTSAILGFHPPCPSCICRKISTSSRHLTLSPC